MVVPSVRVPFQQQNLDLCFSTVFNGIEMMDIIWVNNYLGVYTVFTVSGFMAILYCLFPELRLCFLEFS